MDFFDLVTMLGGLALFLYGMHILGAGLEKLSGGRLEKTLEKLTDNVVSGVLLGALVTAAVQSSSATTVIIVGIGQCQDSAPSSGDWRHYGRQYRYDSYCAYPAFGRC